MMMKISTFLHNYEFIGSVPITVKGPSLRINAVLPLKQLSQWNLKENIVDLLMSSFSLQAISKQYHKHLFKSI